MTTLPEPDIDIQSLVALPPKMTALEIFSARFDSDVVHPITPILERVRAEIDGFSPDLSTASGRKAIASLAYRVTRAKTTLDGIGKKLNDEAKDVPRRIDATRKHCRDLLDQWAEDVRAPLTEWETQEEARKARHTNALTWIGNLHVPSQATAAELHQQLTELDAIVITPAACEEYEAEYRIARDAARPVLLTQIDTAEKREADAAELAALRKAAAERARQEHDEKLRKEGEERARLEAEADARAERERAEREKEALRLQLERAEAERQAAVAAAERKAVAAAAQAKAEVEAKARAEAEDKAKREADKAHRAKINREAVNAFVENGADEDTAKYVVTLIAKGKIPNVTINY